MSSAVIGIYNRIHSGEQTDMAHVFMAHVYMAHVYMGGLPKERK